jgi:V/A-type H+-transporting ATPase subunit I
MAVARVSKTTIMAPRDRREELIERLYHLGAMHVVDLSTALDEEEDLRDLVRPCDLDLRDLRLAHSRCEFLLDLLERYEEKKGGLLSGFLQERIHLTYEEFCAVEQEVDLPAVYQEMEEMATRLRHLESRITEIGRELEALRHWRDLAFPLGTLRDMKWCEARLAVMGISSLEAWSGEMSEACPCSAWEEVRREGERVYLVVMVHRDYREEYQAVAQRYNLEEVQFPEKEGTPHEEMERLEKRLAEENAEKEALEEGIKERLPLKPRLLALDDYLRNLLMKEEVKENFLHTERVVAVEGWVEEARQEEVLRELEELGPELEVSFAPPGEDDVPPTLLLNRRRIKPTESLINLFGLPNHAETDPTPFVAPFFILFFGMCIADVGYGAILALATWWARRKLDLSQAARRFFTLIMYCGIAAVVVGVFTRGYFGIESESLPAFLRFPGSLDVLLNPIPMMLICAALGLTHISLGVAIEMYDNMRQNSLWTGFCEQGTTLLMWLGLAVLAILASLLVARGERFAREKQARGIYVDTPTLNPARARFLRGRRFPLRLRDAPLL